MRHTGQRNSTAYTLASTAGNPEDGETHKKWRCNFSFFARNSPAALKNDGPKSNTSPALHPAALIAGPWHAPSKDACVLVQQHGALMLTSPPTTSATLWEFHPAPFKSSSLKPRRRASATLAPPRHRYAGRKPNFFASKHSGQLEGGALR